MNDRERLKRTGDLPGIQTILEWHGLEVDKAVVITEHIVTAAQAGFLNRKVQDVVSRCESPAERQFLLGFFLETSRFRVPPPEWPTALTVEMKKGDDRTLSFRISPQCQIVDWNWSCTACTPEQVETGECPHEAPVIARCDFRVWTSDPWVSLLVEIDGHDFHDRTKEQAARDRARDRRILEQQPEAFTAIVRFTASEVYADPVACAAETANVLWRRHWHVARELDCAFDRGLTSRGETALLQAPAPESEPANAGAGAGEEVTA